MKKYMPFVSILLIFLFVAIASAAIRYRSETLSEYAQKEPETALPVRGDEEPEAALPIRGSEEPETAPPVKEAERKENETDEKEENGMEASSMQNDSTQRIIYQPDFYYEPLTEDLKKRIYGLSYKEDCPIPYEDLRHVSVLYVNFKGNPSSGDIICNKEIAQDLVEIFYELYQAQYQIEQIRLVDEYNADDVLSMQDNNTSCFNYRTIAGTDKISMHGKGLAIDVNPFFNPYITYNDDGTVNVSPSGSEFYADRTKDFAYKIDENDLCYKLFLSHGFSWGGNWNHSKDYQHFEKHLE